MFKTDAYPDASGELIYSKRKLEDILSGLEGPLNDDLLLWLFGATDKDRHEALPRLRLLLADLLLLRVKPDVRPIPETLTFRFLYGEPFYGYAEQSVIGRLKRLERQGRGIRAVDDLPATLNRLLAIHEAISRAHEAGHTVGDLMQIIKGDKLA